MRDHNPYQYKTKRINVFVDYKLRQIQSKNTTINIWVNDGVY